METSATQTPQVTITNKRVAVLGAGIEGLASAAFIKAKGASVTLLDENPKPEFAKQAEQHGIVVVTGPDAFADLTSYDLLVRSPGIKLSHTSLEKARAIGSTVTSQTQLFLELCPCPIIGVTGTKGKGTTSSLIYEMLKASEKDVYLGGNIGVPPLTFLDKLTASSWVVLELSSFQLQDVTISTHIAVMLMVVPEHLDYHRDMAEYIDAKRNILRYQKSSDFAVLNRDYIATNESDIHTDGQVYYVSRERSSVPQGCFVKDDAVWILKNGQEKKIISTKEIMLPGRHNLENVCAAVMAADLAGVSKENMTQVLKTFKGLEHRLELVKEVNGVRYYDDSFSTTPETAIAAIQAFTAPEILILGGSSKNSDFTELGQVIAKADNIKAIIGIGVEWERIKEAIGSAVDSPAILIEGAHDMSTIVQAAAKLAQAGDVVLLSPACASFDMFKNYKVRGEEFKAEVNKL